MGELTYVDRDTEHSPIGGNYVDTHLHLHIYKHIYIAFGELVAQLYNLGANHMACLLITQAREN